MQNYSSKMTSRVQLPALHKSPIVKPLLRGAKVLDYGAGLSHNKAHDYVMQNGAASYDWYDPNWNSVKGNAYALMSAPFDVILCSNVINVIDDVSVIKDAIGVMLSLLKRDHDGIGVACFTVYEGNKTNIGKPTRDGYQRNETTSRAFDLITQLAQEFLPDVKATRKGRVLMMRYPTQCERCRIMGVNTCTMCDAIAYEGYRILPYYENTAMIAGTDIARRSSFDGAYNDKAYAEKIACEWLNTNRDIMSGKQSPGAWVKMAALENAFAQVRCGYLGVDEPDCE